MRPSALTALLSLTLAFGAPAALTASEGAEGPKSTLSIHPIGTTLLNLPDNHFFQFTYEYHPGPGRFAWAWDPAVLFMDKSETDNPHNYSLWVLPIITPRWYFRPEAQGWFGGGKLGYIHYALRNDDEAPTYTPKKFREHDELGYAAGEAGYKHDWRTVSFYASGQLGLTMGAEFSDYSGGGLPPERSTSLSATLFGQINCALGYRF
jgi:hypothetical protein